LIFNTRLSVLKYHKGPTDVSDVERKLDWKYFGKWNIEEHPAKQMPACTLEILRINDKQNHKTVTSWISTRLWYELAASKLSITLSKSWQFVTGHPGNKHCDKINNFIVIAYIDGEKQTP